MAQPIFRYRQSTDRPNHWSLALPLTPLTSNHIQLSSSNQSHNDMKKNLPLVILKIQSLYFPSRLSLLLSVSLFFCVSQSISLSLSLSLSLSVSFSLSLCLSFCLSLSLCLALHPSYDQLSAWRNSELRLSKLQ